MDGRLAVEVMGVAGSGAQLRSGGETWRVLWKKAWESSAHSRPLRVPVAHHKDLGAEALW
jgi:hypothetical protein